MQMNNEPDAKEGPPAPLERWIVLVIRGADCIECTWPLHENQSAADVDAARLRRAVKGVTVETARVTVHRHEEGWVKIHHEIDGKVFEGQSGTGQK